MTDLARNVSEFERDAIQAVALTLFSAKVVSMPMLNFLKKGESLRDFYLSSLLKDKGLWQMLSNDRKQYLLVLMYHAFGAGAYITAKDNDGHEIDDINCSDVQKICSDLFTQGALELGLKVMNIKPESNNKKVIDNVMMSSLHNIYTVFRSELEKDRSGEYVMALMKIYFNMGVTVALSRI